MDALGIESNEVETIIKKGMKWKETENEKWHANMGGMECVFLKKENALFIVTVYRNGGEK